jgi:transcriptional regulator with XRE-family HTH domain
MIQRSVTRRRHVYRNLLISLRLLNAARSIRYSGDVPKSRWGDAIAFHLAERGWSQRQLADKASVRPNTLTNLIKHGRDSDTATLSRIAAALQIDVAELFLTREQIEILRAHRENRVERLKNAVLHEISDTVTNLVRREVDRIAKLDRDTAARKRSAKR